MKAIHVTEPKRWNAHRSTLLIEWMIVGTLALSGLLHPSPGSYYISLLILFPLLTGIVLLTSLALYIF